MSDFSDLILLPTVQPDTEHYPEHSSSPGTDCAYTKNFDPSSVIYTQHDHLTAFKGQEFEKPLENFTEITENTTEKPETVVNDENADRKILKPKTDVENYAADSTGAAKAFKLIDSAAGNFVPEESKFKVELFNKDLWDKFSAVKTEMIVTKSGRRIFPQLTVDVSGFENSEVYSIYLYFHPVDQNTWKFTGGSWKAVGKNQPLSRDRLLCQHPSSPADGKFWNRTEEISFAKVKVTNNKQSKDKGQVVLNSMSFYQPYLLIVNEARPESGSLKLALEETKFVAVTAYQNTAMTQLKIDHNPFAKGFRENNDPMLKMSMMRPQMNQSSYRPNLLPQMIQSGMSNQFMPQLPLFHPSYGSNAHPGINPYPQPIPRNSSDAFQMPFNGLRYPPYMNPYMQHSQNPNMPLSTMDHHKQMMFRPEMPLNQMAPRSVNLMYPQNFAPSHMNNWNHLSSFGQLRPPTIQTQTGLPTSEPSQFQIGHQNYPFVPQMKSNFSIDQLNNNVQIPVATKRPLSMLDHNSGQENEPVYKAACFNEESSNARPTSACSSNAVGSPYSSSSDPTEPLRVAIPEESRSVFDENAQTADENSSSRLLMMPPKATNESQGISELSHHEYTTPQVFHPNCFNDLSQHAQSVSQNQNQGSFQGQRQPSYGVPHNYFSFPHMQNVSFQ